MMPSGVMRTASRSDLIGLSVLPVNDCSVSVADVFGVQKVVFGVEASNSCLSAWASELYAGAVSGAQSPFVGWGFSISTRFW